MKNRLPFFFLELLGGILFALLGFYIGVNQTTDSGFTMGIPFALILCVPMVIIGIAIPGYFHCNTVEDAASFKMAVISSIVWMIGSVILFAIVTMVTLNLIWINLLSIIFSVVGFNLQVYSKTEPTDFRN